MNTDRSKAIIRRFQTRDWNAKRVVFEYEGQVFGKPEEVFPLLCPAREADWIPGWDAEIIHSETGYAAQGDVFRTPESSGFGEGIWVFVDIEENAFVELVQVTQNILVHLKVSVSPMETDETDRETVVRWDYVLTSITPQGTEMMSKELISKEKFQGLLKVLDHYMRFGEMMSLPTAG